MNLWQVTDRGFLPPDPIQKLISPVDGYWDEIEELAEKMPIFLAERRWREEVVSKLRYLYDDLYHVRLLAGHFTESQQRLERAMLLYSYFASAYVHATDENKAIRIPQEIAKPLVWIGERIGRPPILSYASYCLYNWRKIHSENPPELGNIELLQNFSLENKRDEDWFILVHVDIEWQARLAIKTITGHHWINCIEIKEALEQIAVSLRNMNNSLSRMTENCSPDNYYNKVRPYIFGFEKIIYEGCFDNNPRIFRGETGAQSSIVPLLLAGLGIEHKDSVLTDHLSVMRYYMPPSHRELVRHIEESPGKNYRHFVQTSFKTLIPEYNACIEELAKFRTKHLEYAINYIQKKVDNPTGTGGTPYIPWLSKLRDETLSHLL